MKLAPVATSTAYPATLTLPLDQPDHASRFPPPNFPPTARHQPMDWLYPSAVLSSAPFVSLTGMGGGSLMASLLILLFGVHPLTAVGTDLLYAAVTKSLFKPVHRRVVTMARLVTHGTLERAKLGLGERDLK
jgi:hypothetical protein